MVYNSTVNRAMQGVQVKNLQDYLIERDGAVSREGRAMLRLSKTTGYSVETLRSIAYGRRKLCDRGERAKKLRRALSRG